MPSTRITADAVPNDAVKRLPRNVSESCPTSSVRLLITGSPEASSTHTLTGPVGWIWSFTRVGFCSFSSFLPPVPAFAFFSGVAVGAAASRSDGSSSPPSAPTR